MYRCQICGQVAPPRTHSVRVVVNTRTIRYPYRLYAFRRVVWKNGKRKRPYVDDTGGKGVAVVRELRLCPACAERTAAPGHSANA